MFDPEARVRATIVKESTGGISPDLRHYIGVRSGLTLEDAKVGSINSVLAAGLQAHLPIIVVSDASSGVKRKTALETGKINKYIVSTSAKSLVNLAD